MAGVQNLYIGHSPEISGQFTPVSVSSSYSSFTQNQDRFIPHSQEESQCTSERPSFFTRLVQGIVNTGRNVWGVIREFNPFTQFFNLAERMRIRRPVQEAQNRNELSPENYHNSLQYVPGQNNDRAMFRYYPSDSNKDLIILVLGNLQDFDTNCGINTLAERFHREGHPVVVLRTGDAEQSLRNRFFLSGNFNLHTEVVYAHDRNIINNIRNRRKIFSNLASQRAHLIGHSFGGGTSIRYINEAGNEAGIPISSVTCIDPVQLGHYHLARHETRTPNSGIPYLHIFQDNSYFINGESLGSNNPNITSVHIPGSTHITVTEEERVQNMITGFINRFSTQSR